MITSEKDAGVFLVSLAKGLVAVLIAYVAVTSGAVRPLSHYQDVAVGLATFSIVCLSAYIIIESLKWNMGIKSFGYIAALFSLGMTSALGAIFFITMAIYSWLGLLFLGSIMGVVTSWLFVVKDGPARSWEEIAKEQGGANSGFKHRDPY